MILHFLLLLLCLPSSDAQNRLPNVSTDNVALAVKLSSQLTKKLSTLLDVKNIRDSMESIRLDQQEAQVLVKDSNSLLVTAKEGADASPPDLDLATLSKATAISKKKKAIELTKSHKDKLGTFHAVLQLETDARDTAELLDKEIHRLIATENYADAKEATKQLRNLRSRIDKLRLSEGYQVIAARLMDSPALLPYNKEIDDQICQLPKPRLLSEIEKLVTQRQSESMDDVVSEFDAIETKKLDVNYVLPESILVIEREVDRIQKEAKEMRIAGRKKALHDGDFSAGKVAAKAADVLLGQAQAKEKEILKVNPNSGEIIISDKEFNVIGKLKSKL